MSTSDGSKRAFKIDVNSMSKKGSLICQQMYKNIFELIKTKFK